MPDKLITIDRCLSILFGVSIGDAQGVPVEFMSRQEALLTKAEK